VALTEVGGSSSAGGVVAEGQVVATGTVGGTVVVPVRGYRRAMIKSMTAVATVPHFHLHDEVSGVGGLTGFGAIS
jgi:hypothetical protein